MITAFGGKGEIKNPDTFVLATYGTLRTLDPAACYDTTGAQRIWNIYETLVFFDGSKTDEFIPVLATKVPTLKNGGISIDGKTYTFQIRKGVKFHEGGELTPEDVAYSFKRNMIADPHNFLYTFMHSRGVYGRFMAYKNKEVDKLCEEGFKTVDLVKRQEIYSKLQYLWYEEAIGIPLYQQINVRAYRDYVHGYVPNAMLTDAWEDLKRMSKK